MQLIYRWWVCLLSGYVYAAGMALCFADEAAEVFRQYYMQGNYRDLIEAYEQSDAATRTAAQRWYVCALLELGRYHVAEEAVQAQLQADPSAQVWLDRAAIQAQLQDPEALQQCLDRLAEYPLVGDQPQAQAFYRSQLYTMRGGYRQARELARPLSTASELWEDIALQREFGRYWVALNLELEDVSEVEQWLRRTAPEQPAVDRQQQELALALELYEREPLSNLLAVGIPEGSAIQQPKQALQWELYQQLARLVLEPRAAQDGFERAYAGFRSYVSGAHPVLSSARRKQVSLLRRQGRWGEALAAAEALLESAGLDARFEVDHPEQAAMLYEVGKVYADIGQPTRAESLLLRSLESSQRHFNASHPRVLRTQVALAGIERSQGRVVEARERLEEVLQRKEHLKLKHDRAELYAQEARLLQEERRQDAAQQVLQKIADLKQDLTAWEQAGLIELQANLAAEQGRWAQAHQELQAAARLVQDIDAQHPHLVGLWAQHSDYAFSAGLADEALRSGERARKLLEEATLRGPLHPLDEFAWYTAEAQLAVQAGDWRSAERAWLQAEQQSRFYAPGSAARAELAEQLGTVYEQLADDQQAEAWHAEARGLRSAHAEPSIDPFVLYRDQRIKRRRRTKADPQYQRYQEVLRLAAESLGSLHARAIASGSQSGAEVLFSRALEIYEALVGRDHYEIAYLLDNYASLLRQVGKPKEAEPLEMRARAIRAAHGIVEPEPEPLSSE
jgi:hypothetical protein